MLVRDVLESKGRRIISIDREATVSEAIAKLVQNNIGSLPVVDQAGQLVGIFSERDVLRVIHNRGEGFGRLRVAEVMTGGPVTCSLDDDVNDVMGKMSERHIAKVPVLERRQARRRRLGRRRHQGALRQGSRRESAPDLVHSRRASDGVTGSTVASRSYDRPACGSLRGFIPSGSAPFQRL